MKITFLTHPEMDTTAFTDGAVCYAIGDIHGCYDQLVAMLDGIKPYYMADLEAGLTVYLIFLGDYTDRGPHNIAAIDEVMDYNSRDHRINQIDLAGNHDMMLKLSLVDEDREYRDMWLNNGGSKVLQEIVDPSEYGGQSMFYFARQEMGEHRLGWFSDLKSHFRIGNTIFVHAGVAPWIRTEEDLAFYFSKPWITEPRFAWIRQDFLNYQRIDGDRDKGFCDTHCIVHGHSIDMPTVYDYRIGLDTGCFATKVLTCARIIDGKVTLFQAHSDNYDESMLRIKYR